MVGGVCVSGMAVGRWEVRSIFVSSTLGAVQYSTVGSLHELGMN